MGEAKPYTLLIGGLVMFGVVYALIICISLASQSGYESCMEWPYQRCVERAAIGADTEMLKRCKEFEVQK